MKTKVFILVSLLALACSRQKESPQLKVFRYNESSGINSLDPAFARAQNNIWAVHQIFNTLVEFDENMQLKPSLADSFWIQSQGLEYVFTLKKNIFFHPHHAFADYPQDAELNIDDVLFSFKRLKSSNLASPGAWTMEFLDTLYAVDNQVVFKLKKAFPPFLSILSMKYCSIISKKVAEDNDHNPHTQPIGTGPFFLKLWAENEKIVLRKNPLYFEKDSLGNALPYLDAINIHFITDKQSAFLELRNGQFDFLSGLDPSYKDEILNKEGNLNISYEKDFELHKNPYLNLEYLAFNLEKLKVENSPYAHKEVRLAMNYAIDKSKMLKFLRSDLAYPAHQGVVPPSLYPDGNQIAGYQKNDSLTQFFLNKAGYPKGKGLPSILLNTNPGYADLCEFLQNEWNQAGIPVKLNTMQSPTLRESISTGKIDFFRASWIADYPNPENYIFLFISKNQPPHGPNYSFFFHPKVDSLYEAALTKNYYDATALFMQADSIILSESPVIPLYYDMSVRLVSKKMKGMYTNPMNLLELRRVDKIEK